VVHRRTRQKEDGRILHHPFKGLMKAAPRAQRDVLVDVEHGDDIELAGSEITTGDVATLKAQAVPREQPARQCDLLITEIHRLDIPCDGGEFVARPTDPAPDIQDRRPGRDPGLRLRDGPLHPHVLVQVVGDQLGLEGVVKGSRLFHLRGRIRPVAHADDPEAIQVCPVSAREHGDAAAHTAGSIEAALLLETPTDYRRRRLWNHSTVSFSPSSIPKRGR